MIFRNVLFRHPPFSMSVCTPWIWLPLNSFSLILQLYYRVYVSSVSNVSSFHPLHEMKSFAPGECFEALRVTSSVGITNQLDPQWLSFTCSVSVDLVGGAWVDLFLELCHFEVQKLLTLPIYCSSVALTSDPWPPCYLVFCDHGNAPVWLTALPQPCPQSRESYLSASELFYCCLCFVQYSAGLVCTP